MTESIRGKVAFVAGATGLTGRNVVTDLAAQGAVVHAHVRPDSRTLGQWRERLQAMGATVDETPWDEAQMTKTIARIAPDAVFALLGTTQTRVKRDKKSGQDSSYQAVDYGLTALLRRACEASGLKPRYVYLSAIGVSETSKNPYYQVRARIERELRQGTLPFVVARPGFILGTRDEPRTGETVGAQIGDALLGVAGVFGGGKLRERYRSIRAEDLARALVRLAFDPEAAGRVVEPDGLR